MAPLWPRPLMANIDWTFGFPEQKGVTGAYFIIFLRQGLSTIELESLSSALILYVLILRPIQCACCPNILNWPQWFHISCSLAEIDLQQRSPLFHSGGKDCLSLLFCAVLLKPRYWPCGPGTGPLCYFGSFGPGAGFEAFWSSINISNTLCTTPGCTTNQNFLLQAAQGFMACLYYDAYTAPMLVKVISLQFLPLQHHNYSIQSTNLYPQNTGWLLVSKRVSNCTARGRVAVYHLSLLKLLLRSINTSLPHIGDIGKKKTSITSTATTF